MSQAISIIVGCLVLINGIMGLFGKVMPFSGMDAYTPESLRKMARIIAVPYLITAAVFFTSFYLGQIKKLDSFTPQLICIAVIIVVFIFHIIVNKKVLKKR